MYFIFICLLFSPCIFQSLHGLARIKESLEEKKIITDGGHHINLAAFTSL